MSEAETKEAANKVSSTYLDLEPEILDVMYMAGIAADLAHDALGTVGERAGDYELIRIAPRDHKRLLFAVQKVANMTEELSKTYSVLWEKARGATA